METLSYYKAARIGAWESSIDIADFGACKAAICIIIVSEFLFSATLANLCLSISSIYLAMVKVSTVM